MRVIQALEKADHGRSNQLWKQIAGLACYYIVFLFLFFAYEIRLIVLPAGKPPSSRPGRTTKTKRSVRSLDELLVEDSGGGNQFRRAAKLDEFTLIRAVFFFCNGMPIAPVAATLGLSAKTVRTLYLQLRDRLVQPKFNRWHAAYQRLPKLPFVEMELIARTAFIDTLADCALNETCRRNYTLGNRKARLCRECPLPGRSSSHERVQDALDVIDAVQVFYEQLGIRGERTMSADDIEYLKNYLPQTLYVHPGREGSYATLVRKTAAFRSIISVSRTCVNS